MSRVLVISDFNAELVSRLLTNDRAGPACQATAAPYGQLMPTLVGDHPDAASTVALVWTRPEGVVPGYDNLPAQGAVGLDNVLANVDVFVGALRAASAKFRMILVASWTASQAGRGLGLLNWHGEGPAHVLARMNLRLAEGLAGLSNVYMLDSQQWLDSARPARDARYWYSMKFPFTEGVAQTAARDVKAALRAIGGESRKLIVVDLDDTLWGGIVGEGGWQNLKLGGHDPIGEAYADFQTALKSLSQRGIAIGLVSKNDASVALEAIDCHPEMVLRRDDLAGWRINWSDKAQNIVELAAELKLGLQSVVFIDDNPVERGRVSEALPDVLVPDWPRDPTRYADALRALDCFDQAALTDEDRGRTRMYAQARLRGEDQSVATSMADWLASLDIKVKLEPVGAGNLTRSIQLANKTNQMNLRTRRFTESEFVKWLADGPDRTALAVTVADRFGDIGLTGLVTWDGAGEDVEIVDYVLSCRAMGRQVENLMVHLAVASARAAGRRAVVARLARSQRNNPCLEFWRTSGFTEAEPDVFVWNAAEPYPRPDFIDLEVHES